MEFVQVRVSQMEPGALIAVEIQKRSRIVRTLTFQIIGLRSCCRDRWHERIDALDRIVQHQAALSNDVVAPALSSAQQLNQIETLAEDSWIAVESVIRDHNEDRF